MKKYATAISTEQYQRVNLHVEAQTPSQELLIVLGITFYNGEVQGVVDALKSGGLLVVPAAPALINIKKDPAYYKALLLADIVIPDSGYMTMLWRITQSEKINRISGLEFLKVFFADEEIKESADILMVDPSKVEGESNCTYLIQQGFKKTNLKSYIAPVYDKSKVEDKELLSLIKERRPKYVIINLGGGTQEKLGAYLKANLSYKPAIICTGAAIAFLTGQQVHIPRWADKLYLGWLLRCIEKPKVYIPRYFKAFKLLTLILKFGKNKPV